MEDNCSIKPKNFKEFIRSSWFIKPLRNIAVGAIAGLLFYYFFGNSPFTDNVYGDMLSGIVIGLFFLNIPCLNCISCHEQEPHK